MKLQIENIKGINETIDFERLNLLQGPNGAGKSGVLAALHLGLLGKVPALGIGNDGAQDAGKLLKISPKGGTVRIQSGDHVIERRIVPTGKKARLETEVHRDGEDFEGDEALDLLASDIAPGIVYADFGTLLAATPAKKKEMLLRYLPARDEAAAMGWGRVYADTRIMDALHGAKSPSQVRNTSSADAIAEEVKALRDMLLHARPEASKAVETSDHIHAMWDEANDTEALTKDLHTNAKELESARRALATTVAKVAEITEEDAELVAELGALTIAADTAHRHHKDATAEQGKHEKQRDAVKRCTTRVQEIMDKGAASKERLAVAKAAKATATTAPAAASTGKLDELRKVFNISEVALNAVRESDPKVDPTLTEKHREASQARSEAQRAIDAAMEAGRKAKADRTAAKESGDCPTCGKPLTDATVVEALETELRDLVAVVTEYTALVKTADAELARIGALQMTEQSGIKVRQTAWTKAENAVSKAQRDVDDEEARLKRETAAATASAVRMDQEVEAARKRLEELAQSLKDADADLAQAKTDSVPPVDADEISRLKHLADAAKTKADGARDAKSRMDVVRNADLDGATDAAKVAKAAHKGAVEGVNAYVQSLSTPTRDAVSEAMHALGLGDFVLDVTGREILIGYMRDETYVDLDAMSRGEQVLFAAALLSVLPADGTMKALTMEVAEVAPENLSLLMNWLRDSSTYDVVVLATCHGPAGAADGWKVVTMGGAA